MPIPKQKTRTPLPQISLLLPEHVKLQSVSLVASAPPFWMSFPQKHWELYSSPATEYPLDTQVATHDSMVKVGESGF